MKAVVRLLEEQAERCIQLAYQCRTEKAEKVLRLLAVDLMLAAEGHRTRPVWTREAVQPAPERAEKPAPAAGDRFSELEQIMRAVTFIDRPKGAQTSSAQGSENAPAA